MKTTLAAAIAFALSASCVRAVDPPVAGPEKPVEQVKAAIAVSSTSTETAQVATPEATPIKTGSVKEAMAIPVEPTPHGALHFTLREAEQYALKNHPQIAAAELTADAVRQQIRQARSGFFPQIYGELDAVGAPDGTRLAALGGLNNPTIFARQSDGIVISQLITDFGRTYELTEAARSRAISYDFRSAMAKATIILNVDRAYLELQRAQDVLHVAEEMFKARSLVEREVEALVKSKLKSDLDASFERVYVNQAKLFLIESRSAVGSAEATLSTTLGFQAPQNFILSPVPIDAKQLAGTEPLIQAALNRRPDLAALRSELEAAQRLTKAQRAAQYPRITAQAAAGVSPVRDRQSLDETYYAAGLNVEIPIANGGNLAAKVDEANLAAKAAAQGLIDAQNVVVRDVRLAFLKATTDQERIDVTLQLVQASEEARQLALVRYRVGSSSITDLTQAELNYTEAELKAASARYDYLIGRALLDFVTGARKEP